MDYDEFGFLEETALEYGLPWDGMPRVSRSQVKVSSDLMMSALVWGEAAPELVFLHGGGQNAHTWDTLALALRRPAVAFDLLGHGHSSRRPDRDYSPWNNSIALETALTELAPRARALVGMSLGGATAIRLAATRPDLVERVVIIDVTPQVSHPSRAFTRADRGAIALISGPPTYDSFEAMADAAIALSPNRSAASVRRGVRHNAKRLADGRWAWRYDLSGADAPPITDFTRLWEDVSKITVPAMLVLGGASTLVRDSDVTEMRRRLPGLRVEVVAGAGHAVQSDRPLELARLLNDFVFAGQSI